MDSKRLITLVLVILFALLSPFVTVAATTSGTFVKLQDAGEGSFELVIKNEKGKQIAFTIDNYDAYKQWANPANKGKKVIATWNESGSGKYKFKVLSKLEAVGTASVVAGKGITTVVTKIVGWNEAEMYTFKTQSGDFTMFGVHKKYEPLVKESLKKKTPIVIEAENGMVKSVKKP